MVRVEFNFKNVIYPHMMSPDRLLSARLVTQLGFIASEN